jgi:hypothetical protein
MGFVVDKAALGQVFSEFFGSPAKHSTGCSTLIIIIRGWYNRPVVASVIVGSVSLRPQKRKKKIMYINR